MAGIGFELKKLFSQKGLFALLRAYGYAGIVCTGPMLLGILLLFGVRMLAAIGGADEPTGELLNSMLTYTLLASLFITNILSMVTTRFTADALYEDKKEIVMPSFYGCISIMLVVGSCSYGVFLYNAGIPLSYGVLCLVLFGELVVVWTEINYLTAVKDYRGILVTFFGALVASLFVGYIMIRLGMPIIPTLLFTMTVAYGIMMVWYYYLLISYFPVSKGSSFLFLKWMDQYPELSLLGTFMGIGLFGHMIVMWFSSISVHIHGLYYGAPWYDIPCLFAFMSILITTINFVTSVEVNFYPKYRNYFSLFNDGGSLKDIRQAEQEMRVTLQKELGYTYTKQLFTTILFIVVGTILLPRFPINFSEETLGIYRVLCVGYAFYSLGNITMLILLYFSDNKGALIAGGIFAVTSLLGTIIISRGSIKYFGFGFLISGVLFLLFSLGRLFLYLRKLPYHVLSRQPIIIQKRKTILTVITDYLEVRYEKRGLENAEK